VREHGSVVAPALEGSVQRRIDRRPYAMWMATRVEHMGSRGVCDAGRMPEIGLAPGAAAEGPRPLSWRGRGSDLLASPRVRYVLGVVALGVLYRGVAQIGYELQFAGPVAAIVWLPVGVGIAFLYLGGLRYWPGVLVGDLLANDYGRLPLGSAIGQTWGNVLEVVVATVLLRRLVPRGDPLGSVGGLGRMLVAIGAGTAVSATVGSCSLLLGDVITAGGVPEVCRTWWLGDSSGALIVLPLALAWAKPPRRGWRRRALETALLLVAIGALSALAMRSSQPLTYLVFPPLIWAALRLGRRGATLAVAVAAGFAIWETTRRVGPFAFESVTDSVLATQLYLAVSALSTLFLAAVVSEREAFAASLAASRARLVETAAAERRRIERNLHDGAQQRLTALAVRLDLAAEQARDAPDTAVGRLEAAAEEVSAATEELREFAHGIHPTVLTTYGLAHALTGLAARSAIPIRLVELPATRVDATAEVTAYFVISEAVTNARKHADATSIDVRAAASKGVLRVEIIDDGRGGASETAGSGLQGLRDRVEAIGGSFAVDRADRQGTRILAVLPAPPASG
jgi:signal transduction histidine kinase